MSAEAPSAKRPRVAGESPQRAAALDVDAAWAPEAAGVGDWGAEVAVASLRAYEALPRTGKPAADGGEWVLAAAFLVTPGAGAPPRVVALGTGTKCLTASARSAAGDVVNDCHAEVVARRALHLWLYAQLARAAEGQQHDDCYFTRVDLGGSARFAPRPGVALHMYVSGSPCGDASVLAAALRTGAKLVGDVPLPSGAWREAGGAVQAEGAARRKPGRGEATLSMSCSDKMSRWSALGVQGALLSRFLAAPLRLASLTVASATAAEHLAAAGRAFASRLAAPAEALAGTEWALRPPALFAAPLPSQLQLRLPSGSGAASSPCGFSINWVLGAGGAEVLLGTTGRRAGATRADVARATARTRSRLCRAALLQRYRNLCQLAGVEPAPAQELTYAAVKRLAPDGYAAARAALVAPPSPLAAWIPKPLGEQDFCCDAVNP